VITFLVI